MLPRRVNFGMMSCRASVFVSDKIIDAVLPELSFSHHYSNTHHCSAPHLFFLIDSAANNSGLQISLGLTSLPLSFTSIPSGQIRRESPLFFGTPPHFQRAFVRRVRRSHEQRNRVKELGPLIPGTDGRNKGCQALSPHPVTA